MLGKIILPCSCVCCYGQKIAAKPKTDECHALEEPAICKHTLRKPLKGSLITFSPKSAKIYDWALIECAKEQN